MSRFLSRMTGRSTRRSSPFPTRDLLPLNLLTLESRVVPSSFKAWGPELPPLPTGSGEVLAPGFTSIAITPRLATTSDLRLTTFEPVAVDRAVVAAGLAAAPVGVTLAKVKNPITLTLPTADGKTARFAVWEDAMMEPALAAQFPDIHTYRGQGIDDPYATLAADMTPQGFHASVRSPNGSWFIDPYFHLDQSVYAVYSRSELLNGHGPGCQCLLCQSASAAANATDAPAARGVANSASNGAALRTFRLAVAATGEYTAFQGGTVALAQAAIVTAINRVNQLYETDLCVHLTLVGNNSSLIYTNATTDPYTNNSSTALLSENQANVDAVIGSGNYDIGHVFSTAGGGRASLGVVGQNGSKARGETGTSNPTGDAFYIDYVAHEMGHQFGGNHTFNGTDSKNLAGNRVASAAYEPGSGSTIMAYAGIGGADDYQLHSDSYFHFKSLDEITNYLNTIPNVGTSMNLGNFLPGANAGASYTIPANTPFELRGTGSDNNSGDPLTYCWEQYDLGPAVALGTADNGSSPLVRSYSPTASNARSVPNLGTVLLGLPGTAVEVAATTSRALHYRLTVRDNHAGGGAFASSQTTINAVNTGSAFAITSFNSATTLVANSTVNLTWNVAGTTGNGINCSQVVINYSSDGGANFYSLGPVTANDGQQAIVVPNVATNQLRFMVRGANSIFYDVNNANISVPPTTLTVTNANNSGAGSLRQALLDSDSYAGVQTINFSSLFNTPHTITLASGLTAQDQTAINGPGQALLTINGNKAATVLTAYSQTNLSGLTIANGAGSNGGGVHVLTGGSLILDGITITNNSASSTGGGIRIDNGAQLTARTSTISGNTALRGGGIYFNSGGSLSLTTSTISGNAATGNLDANGGGGIYFFGNASSFSVSNSTIANNSARNSGGGVVLRQFSGSAIFDGATITGNTADAADALQGGSGGGGIALSSGSGEILLDSSIVSGNSAANGRADIASGGSAYVTANYSAVGTSAGANFTGNGDSLGADLRLGTLGLHGGTTATVPLLDGSAAINAGGINANGSYDQRGTPFVRKVGYAMDCGAYEAPNLVVDSTADGIDGNYGPGQLTFREALSLAATVGASSRVTFSPSVFGAAAKQITLTGGELAVNFSVDIRGPGANRLTISGNNTSRIFNASGNGSIIIIGGLTMSGGKSSFSGGALVSTAAALTLDGVAITNSVSQSNGGAASLLDTPLVTIRNSTIASNSAAYGAGGLAVGYTAQTLIENTTIAGNTAPSGGGILADNFQAGASLTIRNSTITANTASGGGLGGGLRDDFGPGVITVTGSIISGNAGAAASANIAQGAASIVANFSALGADSGLVLDPSSGNNLTPGIDLKLGTLGYYGGPVKTIPLAADSPAIDAGNPDALGDDARGFPFVRAYNAADIGAFERQLVIPTVDTTADGNDGDYSAGRLTLREAVAIANANPGLDIVEFDYNLFRASGAKTITLTGGELPVTDSVAVYGPGADHLTISGNSASRAFYLAAPGNPIGVGIYDIAIRNGSTSAQGGAIYASGKVDLTLIDTYFFNNFGAQSGGAVAFSTGSYVGTYVGSINIIDSTIANNSSNFTGGGIFTTGPVDLRISNTTVTGNTALFNHRGGGLYASATYVYGSSNTVGTVNIRNSTVTGNASGTANGGGLWAANSVPVTVVSSILSGNTGATAYRDAYAGPSKVTATYSALGVNSGLVLNAASGNNLAPGVALGLGTIVAAGVYGGNVPTIRTYPGSPLVNAGSNPDNLTEDGRGLPFVRDAGGGTDIGAYEAQNRTFIVGNSGDLDDANYTGGNLSLREAVKFANLNPGVDGINFDDAAFPVATAIYLTGSPLIFSDSVTIVGPGADRLAVSGNNLSRVFQTAAFNGLNIYLTDMTIRDGSTSSAGAGGIYAPASLTLTLNRVYVTANTGSGDGGGISVMGPNSAIDIDYSTISNNVTNSDGGGIFFTGSSSLLIRNSTISGNSAAFGGGIGNFTGATAAAQLNVVNSTVTNNTASISGGGISLPAAVPLTFVSSIVSGNLGPSASPEVSGDTNSTANASAFGILNGFGLSAAYTNNLVGAALNLGPLQNNGGPTPTHVLLAGSAAIDAGDNSYATAIDQRGFPREVGAAADIGAVERQLAPSVAAVAVNDGAAQRSRVTSITITFNGPVNLSADAFTLTRPAYLPTSPTAATLTSGTPAASQGQILVTTTVNAAGQTVATLTFATNAGSPTDIGEGVEYGSLSDGSWVLAITGASVTNVDGTPMAADFATPNTGDAASGRIYRLFGNADGDTDVDLTDLNGFRQTFTSVDGDPTTPVYDANFDFDNDGDVDTTDLAWFRTRFTLIV